MKKLFVLTTVFCLAIALCFATGNNEKAPASAKGVTIVYWPMWSEVEPQGQLLVEAIDAFTKATGIKVDVNWGGSRDTRKTLQPALDAGETIDLFDEDIERVNITWANYLMDLQDMYDKSPLNGNLNSTLIDICKVLGGGTLKTIPYQPSTFIMQYNKDAFDKAGVKKVPVNKEEFFAVCEALKNVGYIPFTVDDAYMAAFFGYIVDRVAGSDAADKIAHGDFSNPAVLKAAKVIEEMIKNGYIDPRAAANIFPAGQNNVAEESVAMYLTGTWLPNEIRNQTREDFRWGDFAMPNLAEGGDGPEANNYGAQCFGINKNCKYPNEVFQLIEWLTIGEWDQKLADATLGVPMGNDAKWPPQIAEAKDIILHTTKRLPWAIGMEDDSNVNASIKTNLALMITGKLDAQGFADAFAKTQKSQ